MIAAKMSDGAGSIVFEMLPSLLAASHTKRNVERRRRDGENFFICLVRGANGVFFRARALRAFADVHVFAGGEAAPISFLLSFPCAQARRWCPREIPLRGCRA